MEIIKIIKDIFKQIFCKHKYREYNNIERVDGKYIERWLICKKCNQAID